MPQEHQQAVWDSMYNYRKGKYPRLVSEGDSWFCYPMWRSMMDYVSQSDRYAICRRGESGRRLAQILADGRYLKAVTKENPHALLISGGGNDFVNHDFVTGADGQGPLFRHYEAGMRPRDVVADKWESKLDDIERYFATICRNVGGLPVIAHGYDYIIPSGKPAAYDGLHVAGPWIRPMLDAQSVPVSIHRDVAIFMIDDLNARLAAVVAAEPTFTLVNLRTLVADAEWANEIHPYESGFTELAHRFLAAIASVLGSPAAASPAVIA